jgi:2-pyrone-4,6-dicarboxylate lactonase
MVPTLPPPLADPHAPTALRLPPGACDTHCHLFGPSDRFPFPPARRYTPAEAGLELYEGMQARMGLSRAVFVQSVAYGRDHGVVLDALRRGQGRYAGTALIDESFSDAEIAALHAAGMRAARFHFISHLGEDADTEVVRRIVDRIAPLGWHVLLHVDGPGMLRYLKFFETLAVPSIVDHMARIEAAGGVTQAAFQALLHLVRQPQRWVKISGADRITAQPGPPYDPGLPYADVVPFARALVEAAPTHVLWGTDWPHTNVRAMPDDGDLVDLLAAFVPDEATRRMILVDNPQRLYGFTTT